MIFPVAAKQEYLHSAAEAAVPTRHTILFVGEDIVLVRTTGIAHLKDRRQLEKQIKNGEWFLVSHANGNDARVHKWSRHGSGSMAKLCGYVAPANGTGSDEDVTCPDCKRLLAEREDDTTTGYKIAAKWRARVKVLEDALSEIGRVACGEDQVAENDSEGMGWIWRRITELQAPADVGAGFVECSREEAEREGHDKAVAGEAGPTKEDVVQDCDHIYSCPGPGIRRGCIKCYQPEPESPPADVGAGFVECSRDEASAAPAGEGGYRCDEWSDHEKWVHDKDLLCGPEVGSLTYRYRCQADAEVGAPSAETQDREPDTEKANYNAHIHHADCDKHGRVPHINGQCKRCLGASPATEPQQPATSDEVSSEVADKAEYPIDIASDYWCVCVPGWGIRGLASLPGLIDEDGRTFVGYKYGDGQFHECAVWREKEMATHAIFRFVEQPTKEGE